jgi:hypothetical protein
MMGFFGCFRTRPINFEMRLASAISRSSRKSCLRPATSMIPGAGLRAGVNSWSSAGRPTAAAVPAFTNSRRFISPPPNSRSTATPWVASAASYLFASGPYGPANCCPAAALAHPAGTREATEQSKSRSYPHVTSSAQVASALDPSKGLRGPIIAARTETSIARRPASGTRPAPACPGASKRLYPGAATRPRSRRSFR